VGAWWVHPGALLCLFMLPAYLFVVFAVPALWPDAIVLRTNDYLSGGYDVLGALTLLILGLGCYAGGRVDVTAFRRTAPSYEISPVFLTGMAAITLSAYAIWFSPAIARGQLFVPREELNRIPGVTSFTQVGVPFVVCYLFARLRNRQRLPRLVHVLFWTVLLATVMRVYMWSERLALIELGVPAVLALVAYARPRRRGARVGLKLVRNFGPFVGLPLLLAGFAATEVFRSWTAYSQTTDLTLGKFVLSRMATYYYTALNNGAGMLATANWPDFQLIYVLDLVYQLPFGIGAAIWSGLGRTNAPHFDFLERFGDPEFNNMSGIYPIFYDLGISCGLLYFAILGAVFGVSYRAYQKGELFGVLFFPSMFVACLEVMRISYVNGTRTFLIWVGAFAALIAFQRRSRVRLPVHAVPVADGS
jgi:hypothetical protein